MTETADNAAFAPADTQTHAPGSFGDDVAFVSQHTALVVLRSKDGRAAVAVAPEYQGRVLTSTAGGDGGASFGWINRAAIADKTRKPHMNVFGGEDRFWLGPEGGQYALYFPPGKPFEFEHWQVPEAIDWGAWEVTDKSDSEVAFLKDMSLTNYSGTQLSLRAERRVRLLPQLKEPPPPGCAVVAYESINTITNTGDAAWTKEGGLVSIWILSMYQPSARTTVVIPFRPGPESELGPVVNDDYFGKVPADRLKVGEAALFFRGDGEQRGKIGIPRPRATPVAGSYDAERGVLTVVEYTLPEAATDYVSSLWEIQKRPYAGDVINSYNDGPVEPGKPPLGPFYEIESSSPAAALAPGQSLTHVHRTLHLSGPRAALDAAAKRYFGVGVDAIDAAFGH